MPIVSNVTTGKPKVAGAIWRAPIGTTLPTDATSDLNAAFKDLGFVSEDGVTNTNSPDSEKIKAWGGQIVLVVSVERQDTFSFTLIETLNPEVAKAVYGDNNVTEGQNGFSVTANADLALDAAYVIDMRMKGGALKRIVIPQGSVSELGDVVYKDDEAVGYEITIDALPDEQGNNHYEYITTV